MTEVAASPRTWLVRHRDVLVVLLFSAVVFLSRSWEGDLSGDPVTYAALAKSVLVTGHWSVLESPDGQLYTHKPPLMVWLVALTFRVLGVCTYAAKLWPCLFAIGTCVLTCLVARRLYGSTAGLLAGCMSATFVGVVMNAADLRLESAVSFYTVLTVYALVRAHQENAPRFLLLIGLAAGLGAMTKAVSLANVASLTIIFLIVWRPRWLVSPWLFAALGLAAVIAAPWHIYAATQAQTGRQFADAYFGKEIACRLVVGTHSLTNLGLEAKILLVYALPWWPLALYGLWRGRRFLAGRDLRIWIPVIWIAEVFFLMAIPELRYDRYLVPLYPAVGMLAAWVLAALIAERFSPRVPGIAAGAAIAVALAELLLPVPMHKERCTGYINAKPAMDLVQPGTTVDCYWPAEESASKMPKFEADRREGDQPGPRLESKCFYYLDRHIVLRRTLDAVDAARARFLISPDKEAYLSDLAKRGFTDLITLDDRYHLLFRQSAPDPGPRP